MRRPSVYTPFLRRFTDERATDLADTVALYKEVRAAFAASIWSEADALDDLLNFVREHVDKEIDPSDNVPLAAALLTCQREILALETTIFAMPEQDWSSAAQSLKEQIDLRRFLRAKQHFLANAERITDQLTAALYFAAVGIGSRLPVLPAEASGAAFTVPLITLIDEPGDMVDRIIGTFNKEEYADAGLFTTLQRRFYENACAASGQVPDTEHKRPLVTADESDLPPIELVETYLKGTPFLDLLLLPVPFTIPEHVRFEHTHIVAGTGHGKTQTLQHLIAGDLSRDPANTPGLVIIDSQGDLIDKIQHIALFDSHGGALSERIVIIDPTDIEHPPALGLFDLNLARVRGYSPRYREQIMNGVIELYDYIFGGLLGAEMTQKQNVIFRYIARLMLTIPDATILTLRDVMQDSAPFIPYFDRIEGSAREFFRNDFNDRQFADTKKQILRRLWGVLENPTFERLFSHPRNKVDMFDALNRGKIVLVNTAKDFLKAERSSILGRFFIALTFQAAMERAAIPQTERRPAFLYIDEAADYFDDTIDSLLTQARKFNLGIVFAHQYLDQLPRTLRASIMTNTSVKLAGGVSFADAHALAPNMGTTHEFIANMRKRSDATEFATFVKNVTPNAIRLTVPFGTMEAMPRMARASWVKLIERNCATYAARRDEPRPSAPEPDTPRPAATPTESAPPSADDWRS